MPMISTEAAISEIISVAPDPPTTPAKVATTHRTQTTATLETSYCGRISLGPLGKQRGRSKLLSQLLCRCWHKTLIAQTSLFSFCSFNVLFSGRVFWGSVERDCWLNFQSYALIISLRDAASPSIPGINEYARTLHLEMNLNISL